MGKGFFDPFEDFHAGRFLEECLRCSGFDVKWLASKTDMEEDVLVQLFAKPNMDAELFIKIGRPMGAAFFDRVHEVIFHQRSQNETTVT